MRILLALNVDLFLKTLPIMLKGMIGIFAVTLIIILSVILLGKLSNKSDTDKNG